MSSNVLKANRSYSVKAGEVTKKWFLIDAEGLVTGRLAAQISIILQGKHRAFYTPSFDCGDNIIVVNCSKIKFSGNKLRNKIYYRHTGYPGGIRSTTPMKLLPEKSTEILRLAVKRMLSKGPMGYQRLSNLYLYQGLEHRHAGQKPSVLDFSSFNFKNKIA